MNISHPLFIEGGFANNPSGTLITLVNFHHLNLL